MRLPLVTVIMPSYNAEKTISKAIHSVLQQDYQNIELIVVNDGSTDGTVKNAGSVHDSRMMVISQENKGLSGARNTGLSYTTGDFVTFVDSDDWVEIIFISSLLNSMLNNHADLAICGMIKEHPDYQQRVSFGESKSYTKCLDNDDFLSLFEGGLINSCCNKLYRTEIIKNNNLSFSGKTLVEDIEFNLKYLQFSDIVNTTASCPYHYLMGSDSLTSKVSEDMIQNYMAVQEQFLGILKEKYKDIANRFVYHQYMSIFLKYLKKVASGNLNAKEVYPILNRYIDNHLIKKSFKSYKPDNYKDAIIHHCIRKKLYFPIITFFTYK